MELVRPLTGETFHIPIDDVKRKVGRSPTADIIFTSKNVSREHCELQWHVRKRQLLIKNVSKCNSLYVEKESLKEKQTAIIAPGSWIGIGVPLEWKEKHYDNQNFVFLQAFEAYSQEDHNETISKTPGAKIIPNSSADDSPIPNGKPKPVMNQPTGRRSLPISKKPIPVRNPPTQKEPVPVLNKSAEHNRIPVLNELANGNPNPVSNRPSDGSSIPVLNRSVDRMPRPVDGNPIPVLNRPVCGNKRPQPGIVSQNLVPCSSSPNRPIIREVINVDDEDKKKLVYVENFDIDIVANESFATNGNPLVMEKITELRRNMKGGTQKKPTAKPKLTESTVVQLPTLDSISNSNHRSSSPVSKDLKPSSQSSSLESLPSLTPSPERSPKMSSSPVFSLKKKDEVSSLLSSSRSSEPKLNIKRDPSPTIPSNDNQDDSDDDIMIIEPEETSTSKSTKRKAPSDFSLCQSKKPKIEGGNLQMEIILQEVQKLTNKDLADQLERNIQAKMAQFTTPIESSSTSSMSPVIVKKEPQESPPLPKVIKKEPLEESLKVPPLLIRIKKERTPEVVQLGSPNSTAILVEPSIDLDSIKVESPSEVSSSSSVQNNIKTEPEDDSAFQYSQINDCILLGASDEEEPSSPTNNSFGPAVDDDDDDIVFLSQTEGDFGFNEVPIKTEPPESAECDSTDFEMGITLSPPESASCSKHLPHYQFVVNDEDHDQLLADELPDLENFITPRKSSSDRNDLAGLVEKLKKKHSNVSAAKPIDPITPPPRYKNDSLKKPKSAPVSKPPKSNKSETSLKDMGIKPCSVPLQKLSKKEVPSPKKTSPRRLKKKKSELKDRFSRKYDVFIKKKIEDEAKKKHHLVDKKTEASSSLRRRNVDENISIQKKRKATSNVPAGIAKTTNKNRSTLMEIDMFEEATPKPTNFRIPKKKNHSEQKTPPLPRVLENKQPEKIASYADQPKPSKPSSAHPKKKTVHFPPDDRMHTAREISPRRKLPLFNCYEFIYTVCRWNYDWLHTYHACLENARLKGTIAKVPQLSCYNSLPTLITYESFEDYHCNFAGLMYHEVWESVYREWSKTRTSINLWTNCHVTLRNVHPIVSGGRKMPLVYLTFVLMLGQNAAKSNQYPTEGNLLVIKHKVREKRAHYFAYVKNSHKKNSYHGRAHSTSDRDTVLYLDVVMAKNFLPEGVITTEVLVSSIALLRNEFRRYQCLCELSTTPLMSVILKPSDLSVVESTKATMTTDHINKIVLNAEQREAVVEVAKKCIFEPSSIKISLIHGPPGTGKSQTITALVSQISKYMKQQKTMFPSRRILLCAPSNAAIDTLTLKLLELRERGIFLNVVRVGVKTSINSKVLPCSYSSLYIQEFYNMVCHQNKSVGAEYNNKKSKVDMITKQYEQAVKNNVPIEEQEHFRGIMVEAGKALNAFQEQCAQSLQPSERDHIYSRAKKKVLQEAEVIATTVGSCSLQILSKPFDKLGRNFACCIIDESGQSAEIDTWLPLNLGIKKFVLVGDHQQLPATILSRHARQNLHQSLFERLYHHLMSMDNTKKLVHTLKRQYRMHPEIMAWPARHFYANNLICSTARLKQKPSFIRPYIVFDVMEGQESKDNAEISNKFEAMLTASLIRAIEPYRKDLSIGVITPYQEQRHIICGKIGDVPNVTVNTVNLFQGQERDIIICSFVRTNLGSIGFVSDKQRLNVALTRAKKCCIIIGHMKSLVASSPDFKSLMADAQRRNLLFSIPNSLIHSKEHLLKMVLNPNFGL